MPASNNHAAAHYHGEILLIDTHILLFIHVLLPTSNLHSASSDHKFIFDRVILLLHQELLLLILVLLPSCNGIIHHILVLFFDQELLLLIHLLLPTSVSDLFNVVIL